MSLNDTIGIFVLYTISRRLAASILVALSIDIVPTVTILFFLYVQFDECLLDSWYNSLIERKIFNSNESRTKCRLNFNHGYWQLLRSVSNFFPYEVCYIAFYGSLRHIDSNYIYDIAPTCMIWKSISLSISPNNLVNIF